MYASPSRLLLALLKANSTLHASLEGTHDCSRPDSTIERSGGDVAEFAALRKRLRQRHREWLKEQDHGVRILGFAETRAHALRTEIQAMLEQRYGIEVKCRFIPRAMTAPRTWMGSGSSGCAPSSSISGGAGSSGD